MELLTQLEREGALSSIDVELARTLCRLAGDTRVEVSLAVALASREVHSGNVCADLERLAGRSAFLARERHDLPDVQLPALDDWLELLACSPLVSREGLAEPARPLVLDRHRLYLARYYEHELRVAEAVRTLAAAPSEPLAPVPAELAARLFPNSAEQQAAALAARSRRLSLIVGGPGTGKTSTVVKLLALLAMDALAAGRPPPRTLLVAPTGKAAQRLSESIARARDGLPVEDVVKSAIETSASTLHRALGPIEGSATRFRHDRERPLSCDLVLLDEASMVDLALMRRFLDAVPAHARVIMLGDPDQLASVEAGGVLHDLCQAAAAGGPLAGVVSRLTVSHRYQAGSGIAALASAVHAQDYEALRSVLGAGLADARLEAPIKPRELGRPLERQARERYAGLKSGDLEQRMATLEQFRVLCAHRGGPASVEQLNPALARSLGARHARGESYPGRPLIVVENDYATGLFNGDVGVVHAEPGRRRALLACFRRGDGALRRISLARLPSCESAYAMTVHKSQGSEFEHVAIVLPERPSPLLTRELLYTAITRARASVTLYANEAALRACILTRVERSSGLAERLAH